MVPSITRVFRKDQTLYVYFEVYDPTMDPDRRLPNCRRSSICSRARAKVYTSPRCGSTNWARRGRAWRRSRSRFRWRSCPRASTFRR